jgi:hypothetical protein
MNGPRSSCSTFTEDKNVPVYSRCSLHIWDIEGTQYLLDPNLWNGSRQCPYTFETLWFKRISCGFYIISSPDALSPHK